MGAILSTDFNPDFMPATVNTMILKYWDNIFSKTFFNWEVVLKKPDHIKLHFINDPSCLLCRPYKKDKELYEPILLNKRGQSKENFSRGTPMPLLEAIKICEKYVSQYKGSFGAIKNKYRFTSLWDDCFDHLEPSEAQKLFTDVITKLEALDLSSCALNYIKDLNSLEYAYHVFYKLTKYVVLTNEEIDSIRLIYSNLDIISKHDIQLFDNYHVRVNNTNHNYYESSLTFSVSNWENIPPSEKEARTNKIMTIIESAKNSFP